MHVLLLLLIALISNLGAAPHITTVTENDPATLVEGVSVINGRLYVGEEDYVVAGAEPIAKRRYYLSGYGGIDQYPHLLATFLTGFNQLHVSEANGTPVVYSAESGNMNTGLIGKDFYGKKKQAARYSSARFVELQGVTNTSKGSILAQHQLKNQKIIFEPNRDPKGKSFCLHAADGTVRRYVNLFGQQKVDAGGGAMMHMAYYYKLESETLPNGRVRRYLWSEQNQLLNIRTTNRQNNKIFAQIDLPRIQPGKMYLSHGLRGSDGRSVFYEFRQTGKKKAELARVESPEFADLSYAYIQNGEECPLLTDIALPQGRRYKVDYEPGGDRKVERLSLPLGEHGGMISTHRFCYGDKRSTVYDALGNKTVYIWNDEYRLTRIERYEGEEKLKNIETFVWNGTNLRCKALLDDQEKPLFARTFECDDAGNLKKEIFWGNLTGKGPVLHLEKDGMPIDDGVEKAAWIQTFTNDGRNLLARREEPNGLIAEYEYLPHAHLVKTKFLSDHGRVFQRTSYIYNDDDILIREIVDDGSSRNPNDVTDVLVRKIREITPRQSQPYIGMPEWIEEKYWDGSREISLGKVKLHYGNGAVISQRDVCDAKGEFRYSLHYKYDSKGRLKEETNAIGQTAFYEYDAVGNKTLEKPFDGKTTITFDYDLGNRLRKKEIVGVDGTYQKYLYEWNHKHELVSETDPYGNKTSYTYNAFGKRTKTISPHTQAGSAVTISEYDSAGNEILTIDPEGNETQTSYNSWGKPVQIFYPDHALEDNQYYLDGTLAKSADPSGLETNYRYDALGHLIEKTTLHAKETYLYRSDRLISKTDRDGHITTYSYDAAGRKIGEEIEGRKTTFTYDELNRLHQQIEHDLITQYSYDLLGRLTQEQIYTGARQLIRQVLYEYDSAGNRSKIIRFVDGNESIEQFDCDSLNRLIKKTNPLYIVETTRYEIVTNDLGQNVLKTIHTDALGLETIDTCDALGHIARHEKRKQKTLFLSEYFYNLNGLKTHQTDTIYSFDGASRLVSTRWIYDERSRLIRLIEADSTLDAKETAYSYTDFGALEKVTKPNGIDVVYQYNDLQQNCSIRSSDGTVEHAMTYDLMGHLLTTDGISREVDAQGRIQLETYPDGKSIHTTYDLQGRKKRLEIPLANCMIDYVYRGSDLTRIIRKDLHQNSLYQHQFVSYDLAGNLKQEQLIGKLGSRSYGIDLLSRRVSVQAPHFSQEVRSFDLANNIKQIRIQQEEISYEYDDLYQLILESGPTIHRYRYDSNNNRLQKDGETVEINALNQDLSHFIYDKNGNPSHNGDAIYHYDALDRLIRIETPTFVQTFVYDSLHRCLAKTTIQNDTRQTQTFLYDGQNEIASFDENNQVLDLRVLGPTSHAEIGSAVAIELNQRTFAPIHDLQGNIAAILPLDHSQPSFYRYTAFGEEALDGPDLSPWRFSSKRIDQSTGLVNYGRRYYLPSYGRWLTPDPLGFTAGMNLYAFVHNNPLTHLDDYGLLDQNRWDQTKQLARDVYNSPRFQGAMQALGGLSEAGVGAGLTLGSGGWGASLGWAAMTHGMDRFFTGLKAAYYGKPAYSVTNRLLQKAGASSLAAGFIDDTLGMGFTMGAAEVGRGLKIGSSGLRTAFEKNRSVIPAEKLIEEMPGEKILFGQSSVSAFFSEDGNFKLKSISEVVRGLKKGTILPDAVPIELIVRNGQKITLNNRSLLALRRAGMKPKVIIDKTGIKLYEDALNDHLKKNLPSDVIKIRGGPPGTSFIGPLN